MADVGQRSVDLSTIGVSGLPTWGGYVYDEWLPELQGPRGRRVLREMADNDPIIGAILFSLEMLIRQVDWKVVESKSDPEDPQKRAAYELISTAFTDMDRTWDDTLSEILSFLPYGFSPHELIYKRRQKGSSKYTDGQIGWASWPMRGQESLQRWEFDDHGNASAMVQLGPPDYIVHTIPMEKMLLFRTTTRRNNPEGRSILRSAYLSWYRKHKIEAIEGIGIERDIAGLPVMYVPGDVMDPNAGEELKASYEQAKRIVRDTKRDEQEGIVLPSDRDEHGNLEWEFKLLSAAGNRQFNIDAVVARYDQRMTMTTMADFLTLGHERVGSNALAQEKGRLFTAAIGGWLSVIAGVINNNAIPRLLELNGFDIQDPPRFEHGEVDRPDLEMLGNYILHLAQAGMPLDTTPGGPLVKWLMESAHLPEPPANVPPNAVTAAGDPSGTTATPATPKPADGDTPKTPGATP